jgi:hypothetical protein
MASWRFSIVIFAKKHIFRAYHVIMASTISFAGTDWGLYKVSKYPGFVQKGFYTCGNLLVA